MPHLICYDITKDSFRTKLGKKITAAGLDRINKSVYLGTIKESSLKQLDAELAQLMQQKAEPHDSLIILPVTQQQVGLMRIYGNQDLDKDDLAGLKSTLIV